MKTEAPNHHNTEADCSAELARAIVTVVSVDGQTAHVESSGGAGCSSCAGSRNCGTKSLMAIFGNKTVPLKIDNVFDAAVGDQIEIGIEQATILKLSALSYLLPLLGLLGGGSIATVANASDLVSFGLGLSGLLAGFAYSRHLYTSDKWERDISPVCLRRVSSGDEKYVELEAIG